MKLIRFADGKAEKKGILTENGIRRIEGSFFGEFIVTEETYNKEDVKILPPVMPSKIVCVARNYAAHAKELGNDIPANPLIFLKPNTCVIAQDEYVEIPKESRQVDYEGELGLVISKKCRNIQPGEVADYTLGYTIINDYTARDIQKDEGKFTRAKGFDTFAPLGPVIETDYDWKSKQIRTMVNGDIKQDGATDQMIFGVDELVAFISKVMTLLPGDVIATGTPSGVGPVKEGDEVVVEIEGIGNLRNYVSKA